MELATEPILAKCMLQMVTAGQNMRLLPPVYARTVKLELHQAKLSTA